MKRGIRDWKAYARGALSGNFGTPILGMIAVFGITFLGNRLGMGLFHGTSVFSIVISQVFLFILSLVMSVLSAGLSYMFMNIARGRAYSMGDLLFFFKNHPDRVIVTSFVLAVIDVVVSIPFYYFSYTSDPGATIDAQTAWMGKYLALFLLSTVLNVLFTMPFAMAYYLQADDLQLGGIDALKASARMMKGNLGNYLILKLSFIPLILLSAFTLYIGLLWLFPYMEMATVMFYRELRGELDIVPQKPGDQAAFLQNLPEEQDNSRDDSNSEA